jgi:hypothetical protein
MFHGFQGCNHRVPFGAPDYRIFILVSDYFKNVDLAQVASKHYTAEP